MERSPVSYGSGRARAIRQVKEEERLEWLAGQLDMMELNTAEKITELKDALKENTEEVRKNTEQGASNQRTVLTSVVAACLSLIGGIILAAIVFVLLGR